MSQQERMTHRGFSVLVEWDDEDGLFFGDVEGLDEYTTIEVSGKTLDEARRAFVRLLDWHLDGDGVLAMEPVGAMAQSV